MYCRNCGKKLDEQNTFCSNCGVAKGIGYKYCFNCATQTAPDAVSCYNCGASLRPAPESPNAGYSHYDQKSKIAAGVLGILVGAFGIHNFYLGFTSKALTQLLLTVLTCGIASPITGIWGLVEGILILTGNTVTDAHGIPLRD